MIKRSFHILLLVSVVFTGLNFCYSIGNWIHSTAKSYEKYLIGILFIFFIWSICFVLWYVFKYLFQLLEYIIISTWYYIKYGDDAAHMMEERRILKIIDQL